MNFVFKRRVRFSFALLFVCAVAQVAASHAVHVCHHRVFLRPMHQTVDRPMVAISAHVSPRHHLEFRHCAANQQSSCLYALDLRLCAAGTQAALIVSVVPADFVASWPAHGIYQVPHASVSVLAGRCVEQSRMPPLAPDQLGIVRTARRRQSEKLQGFLYPAGAANRIIDRLSPLPAAASASRPALNFARAARKPSRDCFQSAATLVF